MHCLGPGQGILFELEQIFKKEINKLKGLCILRIENENVRDSKPDGFFQSDDIVGKFNNQAVDFYKVLVTDNQDSWLMHSQLVSG